MLRTIHIAAILLAIDLAALGLLWYGDGNMRTIKSNEIELRTQILDENQKALQLAALEQTLASAEKDRENMEKYLIDPSDESQIALVSQLEHLGLQTTGAQVIVSSLDLRSNPPALHAELTTTGSWQELYHLLRLVETIPTHIVVTRFSVSRSNAPDANGKPAESWTGLMGIDITSLRIDPAK